MILTEYDYDTDIAVQREEAYEEGLSKGLSQAISQGAKQKAIETAKNLLNEKLPIEQVARCTGLSLENVKQLSKELRELQTLTTLQPVSYTFFTT